MRFIKSIIKIKRFYLFKKNMSSNLFYNKRRLFDELGSVEDSSSTGRDRSSTGRDRSSTTRNDSTGDLSRGDISTRDADGACPAGYRYRKEYYVPGGCVANSKNTMMVDARCPAGMHWRKTFKVKTGCSKTNKKRLQKNRDYAKSAELPTCEAGVVTPVFSDYMRLIASDLKEYFELTKTNAIRDPKVISKMKRRFMKSVQKKLKRHNCEFRPTSLEVAQMNNMISNVLDEYNKEFGFRITEKDNLEAMQNVWQDVEQEPHATFIARPSARKYKGQTDNIPITGHDMQELYELYFIFELYNDKQGAELTNKGRQLMNRYKSLFQKLALYHQSQLDDQQLLQYIKNYGESQLEPVTLTQMNKKYGGPFWNASNLTVHCPHCNSPISISNYEVGAMIQCPICQQNIKLN